jgi:hypothetical protein
MLQRHRLLNNVVCSAAKDCCSKFRHKLLDTEHSMTSNTVTMEEPNIGHSSVSVYRQLHITNCRLQFMCYVDDGLLLLCG